MIKALRREYFRTTTVRTPPVRGVDRNNNVIRGVKLIEMGQVNDNRPFTVDEETLDSVVRLAAQNKAGLRSRFTHPNLSDDGLGSFLGRLLDVRRDGEAVFADLHLSDAAFNSPRGNLGSYVMMLAEDDPQAFGMSLATVLDDSMFMDEDLEPDEESDEESEDEDEVRDEVKDETPKLKPLRFKQVYAGDVVDSPAATRSGLFGFYDIPDERSLPAMATWVMDRYFKGATQEEVLARFEAFLKRYYAEVACNSTEETTAVAEPIADELIEDTVVVEETVAVEPTEATAEATQSPVEEAATAPPQETTPEALLAMGRQYADLFGAQGAVWFLEGKKLEECWALRVEELTDQVKQLQDENADLETRLEAALAIGGEDKALSAEPDFTDEQRKKAKKEAKIVDAKKRGAEDAAAKWATMYDKD